MHFFKAFFPSAKHSSAWTITGHVTHKTPALQGTVHSTLCIGARHTGKASQVPWSVFLNKSWREEETVRGKCAYNKPRLSCAHNQLQVRNLVQETLVAKSQASYPSPFKAAGIKLPVCKVYLCCSCPPSWLFLPAEGLVGPTEQGLFKLVLLLQTLQSECSNEKRHWTVPVPQQCSWCSVWGYCSAHTWKAKDPSLHLTREESFRIERER